MSVEQVATLIQAALSSNVQEQEAAQTELGNLKQHAEFPASLLIILLKQDAPLVARQMAGVLLKQFSEGSWAEYPHTATKEAVKTEVIGGLGDSLSKIRSSVAAVVSEIACHDFPDAWPNLLDQLMGLLATKEANKIHGVVKVLTEISTDVTDNQVYAVAPVLFPLLVQLFQAESEFTPGVRAKILSIFSTFITLISHMDTVDSNANQNLIFPYLPDFVNSVVKILGEPITMDMDDFKMRTECVQFMSKLVTTFPKQAADKVSATLPLLWKLLTVNAEAHITGVVNNPEYDDGDEVDSDGSEQGFSVLVIAIFEFIQSLCEKKKYRTMIRAVLEDVVFYLITYLSIPEYQMVLWDADPEKYVEDDDEDSTNYTVRIGAMELLGELAAELKASYVEALIKAVTRHMTSVGDINEGYNWKVYEGCASALNVSGDMVEECLEAGKVDFNFGAFYETVVKPALTAGKPYLLGRCLWLTASYIKRLPNEEALATLLKYTLEALKPGTPAPVMIGAMKGLYAMIAELEQEEEQKVLHNAMELAIPALFVLAGSMDGDLLMLCLDVLRVSVPLRPDIVAKEADKVNTFLLELFAQHATDTFILSQVNEVLMTMAEIPECHGSIERTVIPTLISTLKNPDLGNQISNGHKAAAVDDDDADVDDKEQEEDVRTEIIDLLTCFVRKSPQPLPEIYLNTVFPDVMAVTLSSMGDSTAVMQSGGELVRACLAGDFQRVSNLNMGGEISGLEAIFKLIVRMLDPDMSEYGALYAGRLVSSLIKHTGISDRIKEVLQGIINKLTKCESPSVQQSLIVVFLKLFHHDMEGSMVFLQSLTTPSGDNGLAYILKTWCEIQELFAGQFDKRLSVVVLTKLLPLLFNTPLASIMINDEVMSLEGDRITRSNTKQNEPTTIPITVKIFKLLVQEYSDVLEERDADQSFTDDEDEDEDDEPVEELLTVAQIARLINEDDDDEDEEDKDDPLNELDLQSFLSQFLTQLSQHETYSQMCTALTDSEKKVLSSMQLSGS